MTLGPVDAPLFALAIVGSADALYFSLVSAGRVEPDAKWVPRFCRMDRASCGTVLHTAYARLFGVPNSTLGLGWFSFLAAGLLLEAATPVRVPCAVLLGPATVAATYSVYLASVLRWRLRVSCVLCYVAHATNFAILGLVGIRCAVGPS